MKLYIGNKNYSSWSMRAWVLLRALGIPFEEVKLRLDSEAFQAALATVSPARRVPVLVEDDGFAVWDTLAITEYLAERHPEKAVWPRDSRARARARSVCAEMHGGFMTLREACPMNIEAYFPEVGARLLAENAALRAELERMDRLWSDALRESRGPFLFGEFGAADAYFAPVVMRTTRFALPLSAPAAAYAERIQVHPAVAAWVTDALAEAEFLALDEPYRHSRG